MLDTPQPSNQNALTTSSNPALDQSIEISTGSSVRSNVVTTSELTVRHFLKTHFQDFAYGDKDGDYILPATCHDGLRSTETIKAIHLIIFDIDDGQDTAALRQKVEESGYIAALYNTHSHGATKTTIFESALRGSKTQSDAETPDLQQLRTYLASKKSYSEAITSSIEMFDEATEGDKACYVVRHAPVHKTRIVFVLKKPLRPSTESSKTGNRQLVDDFKHVVKALADDIGLARYDAASEKPAQPMYLPRIANKAALQDRGHVLEIINLETGTAVDPSTLKRSRKPSPQQAHRRRQHLDRPVLRHSAGQELSSGQGAEAPKLYGEQLFTALALHKSFNAAAFLEEMSQCTGLEIRTDYNPDTGKISIECPYESNHTPTDGPDIGFCGIDHSHADVDAGVITCRHDSCADINQTKFWIRTLLELAQEDSFEPLLPNCDVADQTKSLFTRYTAAERLQADRDAFEGVLTALNSNSTDDDVDILLTAVVLFKNQLLTEKVRNAFARANRRVSTFDARLKEIKEEHEQLRSPAQRPAGDDTSETIPDDVEAYRGPIDIAWPIAIQIQSTIAQLQNRGGKDPYLYSRPEGGSVCIQDVKDQNGQTLKRIFELHTKQRWEGLINPGGDIVYEKALHNGAIRPEPCPSHVANSLAGAATQFPVLNSIMSVPVWSRTGTFITESGYCKDSACYIDVPAAILPLPQIVQESDVTQAKRILNNALIDFPLSDKFDGTEDAPIRSEKKDPDGYPDLNWQRGEASRANFIAMLLQPSVRAMILGPCPAYHIDKPAPGSGAGALASVIFAIYEGRATNVAETLPAREEERQKSILASLLSGDPIMFLDNLPEGQLHSESIAMALTAGYVKGRRLGATETVTAQVTGVWIIAGNGLTLTDELARRCVPIRIDTGYQNPAQERTKFKHEPLSAFLEANRFELIWALNVLVKNWIQAGQSKGTTTLASFVEWSQVIGGILEAAGIQGFLGNTEAYLNSKTDDAEQNTTVVSWIWENFANNQFSASELYDRIDKTDGETILRELGIQSIERQGIISELGKHLAQKTGRTFNLDDGTRVRWQSVKHSGKKLHCLKPVR